MPHLIPTRSLAPSQLVLVCLVSVPSGNIPGVIAHLVGCYRPAV